MVVSDEITKDETEIFATQVLDRFSNPFIDHLWINITVQYTSKMEMRTVPLIVKHYALTSVVPNAMALGVAAYILFMQTKQIKDNLFFGELNGADYSIQDDKAILLNEKWALEFPDRLVNAILKDTAILGADIGKYPNFGQSVSKYLIQLVQQGANNCLLNFDTSK